MKRFLILMTAVLLSNFVKADVSCWYYPTYNYYLFKILDTQTEDEDFLEYWKNYAGGKTPVYSYDFSYGIDAILSDIENGSSSKAVIDAVKAEGATLTDNDFRKFLKLNLDNYKRPRDFEFVEKLPKNALNKVLKRKLREEAVAKIKEQLAAASADKPAPTEAE